MKRNRGFTLMEMLIVVAIIAVLAAIAIPVFNGSLHKAKVAADMANVRAYYAELQTQLILTGESDFTENRYLSEITFSACLRTSTFPFLSFACHRLMSLYSSSNPLR